MLRMLYLSLGLTFIQSPVWATVSVDWVCGPSAIKVDISLDESSKLQLRPDVIADVKGRNLPKEELSKCVADFQSKVAAKISTFKKEQCPLSQNDFCFTSNSYVDIKLREKISKTLGSSVLSDRKPKETPEAYLEEKIAKREISPSKLSETFTYKGKSYKVSDFDKVVGDNIENVFLELNRSEAKQYVQNYMVAKWDVLNTTTNSPKRTEVLNNLNQMFGYIYGERGREELAKMLECKPEDALKPIEEIIHRVEEIKNKESCEPLRPGAAKLFEQDYSNYYATGDYLLTRKPDGNYQALLNLNFKRGSGTVSPEEMLQRTKACLAEASPFMKGPTGELIELVAMDPAEISKLPRRQRPKENSISVEKADFGTNAAQYAESVKCPTIVHEVLHLMGLCDEYEETRSKYGDMWNCRVVTKAPSIMRELAVYDRAVSKTNSCECNSQPCSVVMRSTNQEAIDIYTKQSAYDATDFRFRNKYCSVKSLPTSSRLTDPGKPMVLKAQTEKSFIFEGRWVIYSPSAPNYAFTRNEFTCICPEGDSACMAEKSRVIENIKNPKRLSNCPTGTKLIGASAAKKVNTPSLQNNVLTFTSDPQLPSLLQPNHFFKILEGTCAGKSSGYQECADFAYKNNRSSSCNIPEKCRDDSYYLGAPQ